MAVQADVKDLMRRTRQYEFADGLRDLQLALMFGLSGAGIWLVFSPVWFAFLGALVLRYGRWAAWAGLLGVFLPALTVFGMLGVMKVLRSRWLWARTGIVRPVRWAVPRRVSLISALILIGSIALGLGLHNLGRVDGNFVLRMLWTATGWSFGYTLVGVGRELALARYIRIGLVGAAASTVILLTPISFGEAGLALGLGWFLVLSVSGGVTLRRGWPRAEEVTGRGSDQGDRPGRSPDS